MNLKLLTFNVFILLICNPGYAVEQHAGGMVQDIFIESENRIEVTVSGIAGSNGKLVADGITTIPIKISLLDGSDQPVKGIYFATVSSVGAKLVSGEGYESVAHMNLATSPRLETEIQIVDGVGEVNLVSPEVASDVVLTIDLDGKTAEGVISFAPDLRPLMVTGVLEGTFYLSNDDQSVTSTTGINDGFEKELRELQASFDNGKLTASGRAAFFVKGAIKGSTLLTATYDSEKETRERTLAAIDPEKYYPVMGDQSTNGNETKSSFPLYIRLDNGSNYALLGDFTTGDGFSSKEGLNNANVRNLGLYNRSMSGIRSHVQKADSQLDVFAMHDSLKQAVEEYRANGTSGPFSVANLNVVENSEKLEIIVRDRNNPSTIISTRELVRFTDYSFEPFSGRILLGSPLASFDENLNPVSLRITYELDGGGESAWVYGVSGQKALTQKIEIGGNYIKDESVADPQTTSITTVPGQGARELRELTSANLNYKFNESSSLVAEVASTQSATVSNDIRGSAYRLEFSGEGVREKESSEALSWNVKTYIGDSEEAFHNPASSFSDGRREFAWDGAVDLTQDVTLITAAKSSLNKADDTARDTQAIYLEKRVNDQETVTMGVRHLDQTAGAPRSYSTSSSSSIVSGQGSIYSSDGLNPAGAGFWGTNIGVDPVTGQPLSMLTGELLPSNSSVEALDVWRKQLGIYRKHDEHLSTSYEVGVDEGFVDHDAWAAFSANYQYNDWKLGGRVETPTDQILLFADYSLNDTTTIYSRLENTNGLSSGSNVYSNTENLTFIMGLKKTEVDGLETFSEYRLKNEASGSSSENATGIRNTKEIAPGVKASFGAERLKVLDGDGRSASALTGAIESDKNGWRSKASLEWRELERSKTSTTNDSKVSWLNTLHISKKLNKEWTGLAKNYLLVTDSRDKSGRQLQNKFQLGLAYRPAHRNDFDALFRYENKQERNEELAPIEKRLAHVVSSHLNYHPQPAVWVMGRIAAKSVEESLIGVDDKYRAWLVSGRIIHDLPKGFDLGLMGSLMGSPDGDSRQHAIGVESGYNVADNVWVSLGYNFKGFKDKDLTGSDYTSKGTYLRVRAKF